MKLRPYRVLDDQWIELLEGPYKGIIYKYGKVQLLEEDDYLRMRFEYFLKEEKEKDPNFIQYIGPILEEMIENGLMRGDIIYTGGT